MILDDDFFYNIMIILFRQFYNRFYYEVSLWPSKYMTSLFKIGFRNRHANYNYCNTIVHINLCNL